MRRGVDAETAVAYADRPRLRCSPPRTGLSDGDLRVRRDSAGRAAGSVAAAESVEEEASSFVNTETRRSTEGTENRGEPP
jgi:hypothetical protein